MYSILMMSSMMAAPPANCPECQALGVVAASPPGTPIPYPRITYAEAYARVKAGGPDARRFVLAVDMPWVPAKQFYGVPVYVLTYPPPAGVKPGYYHVGVTAAGPVWWTSGMEGGYAPMPAPATTAAAALMPPVGPIRPPAVAPYQAPPVPMPIPPRVVTYDGAWRMAQSAGRAQSFVLAVYEAPRPSSEFYGSPVWSVTGPVPTGVEPGHYQVMSDRNRYGTPIWWKSGWTGWQDMPRPPTEPPYTEPVGRAARAGGVAVTTAVTARFPAASAGYYGGTARVSVAAGCSGSFAAASAGCSGGNERGRVFARFRDRGRPLARLFGGCR
jgi:hypothetical protein